MNPTTLTDRVISILANGPILSVDVWDALGDVAITQAEVTSELMALTVEGTATRDGENGKPGLFSLTAQAVAS